MIEREKERKKERKGRRKRESRNDSEKAQKRKMRDDQAIHKKNDVLTVMKFIKTHPMKIGLGVDRVNCGGVKLLCI
jgi:hypothetical protein